MLVNISELVCTLEAETTHFSLQKEHSGSFFCLQGSQAAKCHLSLFITSQNPGVLRQTVSHVSHCPAQPTPYTANTLHSQHPAQPVSCTSPWFSHWCIYGLLNDPFRLTIDISNLEHSELLAYSKWFPHHLLQQRYCIYVSAALWGRGREKTNVYLASTSISLSTSTFISLIS